MGTLVLLRLKRSEPTVSSSSWPKSSLRGVRSQRRPSKQPTIMVFTTLNCSNSHLRLKTRHQIYDCVFVKPTYIGSTTTQHSVQTKAFNMNARTWRILSFAMTCRQIYEESTSIFYSKKRLRILLCSVVLIIPRSYWGPASSAINKAQVPPKPK